MANYILGGIAGFVLLILIIGGAMAGCPTYNVWQREMQGKAELAQADSNRRIAVLEAVAKRDSASMLAEAEVERAKGVAKANKIIGDSLHDNQDYLKYLWVTGLEEGSNREVIYVPTEANLPILEASRLAAESNRGHH